MQEYAYTDNCGPIQYIHNITTQWNHQFNIWSIQYL